MLSSATDFRSVFQTLLEGISEHRRTWRFNKPIPLRNNNSRQIRTTIKKRGGGGRQCTFYYVSATLGGSKNSILACQILIFSFTLCYTSSIELDSVNLYCDDNRLSLYCNKTPLLWKT
jgi:hypothetical protein